MPYNLINKITSDVWAMTEPAVQSLADIVKAGINMSESNKHERDTYNISPQLGERIRIPGLDSLAVYRNGNIATLFIDTMIAPRNDMFSYWFGLVTIEDINNAMVNLDQNENVDKIILAIDSPGGLTTGVEQGVKCIADCNTPVYVYAYGTMASLAYWIGSAADVIVAAPTARIGSIGTLVQMQKDSDESITLISSLSPKKNPDPETKDGAAQIVELLDDITIQFHKVAADNRGTTQAIVAENFGKGAVFIAEKAKSRGMIDGIANTIEDFIKNIDSFEKISNISDSNDFSNKTEGQQMATDTNTTPTAPAEAVQPQAAAAPAAAPVAVVEPVAAAPVAAAPQTVDPVAQERTRIQSIEAIATNFAGTPSNVQASIKAIVDEKKFQPGATADSVNSEIVAKLPELLKGNMDAPLASGREMADTAATIPVGSEIRSAASDNEQMIVEEDQMVAGLTSCMEYTNTTKEN